MVSGGPSSFFSSALARARRVWPSASASRMLRDTSTSTGTIASREPAGGRIGDRAEQEQHERREREHAQRRPARRAATRVSGDSGRRYSTIRDGADGRREEDRQPPGQRIGKVHRDI